jgi:hypothetical protein
MYEALKAHLPEKDLSDIKLSLNRCLSELIKNPNFDDVLFKTLLEYPIFSTAVCFEIINPIQPPARIPVLLEKLNADSAKLPALQTAQFKNLLILQLDTIAPGTETLMTDTLNQIIPILCKTNELHDIQALMRYCLQHDTLNITALPQLRAAVIQHCTTTEHATDILTHFPNLTSEELHVLMPYLHRNAALNQVIRLTDDVEILTGVLQKTTAFEAIKIILGQLGLPNTFATAVLIQDQNTWAARATRATHYVEFKAIISYADKKDALYNDCPPTLPLTSRLIDNPAFPSTLFTALLSHPKVSDQFLEQIIASSKTYLTTDRDWLIVLNSTFFKQAYRPLQSEQMDTFGPE